MLVCQSEETFDPTGYDIQEDEIVNVAVAEEVNREDEEGESPLDNDDRFFSLDQICRFKYTGLCRGICVSITF